MKVSLGLIVIFFLIIIIVKYVGFRETFTNNMTKNNINTTKSEELNTSSQNNVIESQNNVIEPQNNVIEPQNNIKALNEDGANNYAINTGVNGNNALVDIKWNPILYEDKPKDTTISTDLDVPDMVLDNVGTKRIIINWRSPIVDGHTLDSFKLNVYQCGDVACDISKSIPISTTSNPSRTCNNCFAVVDDIDLGIHTYLIELSLIYKNESNGAFVETPKNTITTAGEIEYNLDNLYQTALENLISKNIENKYMNLEQSQQSMQIERIKEKLSGLKSKLSENENYESKLASLNNHPYEMKTIYNPVDLYDPNAPPQQTYMVNGKTYFLGMT